MMIPGFFRPTLSALFLWACLFGGGVTGQVWAAGEVDMEFNPGGDNNVYAFALQPDGKIVVGGSFTAMGGSPRSRLARLQPDGTLDASFPGTVSSVVYGLAVRADQKLLVSGYFNSVNGQPRGSGALLSANGALEEGFNPQTNQSLEVMALQPDGRVVIGGFFTQVSGVTRNYIAGFTANGSVDEGLNPDANAVVRCLLPMPDGSVFIAGSFTTLGGTTRERMARLNSDGSVDDTFVGFSNGSANAAALLPDGKIMMGGNFTLVGGVARACLARLNANGSLDTSYPNPLVNGQVHSMALQTDGKLIIGGQFTSVLGTPRNRLARLNADGSLDTTFDPDANSNVHSLMLQKDGRILVGGVFSEIGDEARNSIARLTNDVAVESLVVPDPGTVRWMRSGASPEVTWTEFDVSVDGGEQWTPLGNGTRIAGGWELSGLSLPDGGYVRARGVVTGGRNSSSSWRVESMKGYHSTMVVEHPASVPLENVASTVDFGPVAPEGSTTRTFTLNNVGTMPLSELNLALTGASQADYQVTVDPVTPLPVGESTTFTISFTGSVVGVRQAGLRVTSSASDDAFDLMLTGRVLSFETDGDGDGLSDASELQMAALGFDWQAAQAELVGTLFSNASKAGLYTKDQVQTLNVGSRLIMRDPVTKDFAISIGVKQSADLAGFQDLLLTAPMATFTPEGRVEFRFTQPGPTQFFKLEAQ